MKMKIIESLSPFLPWQRLAGISVLVIFFASCMSGALSLPFLYESSTMYYKFGFEKLLLRLGKMVGLAAALLLLLQLPLAGRLKTLDRLFSLPVLYRFHRLNAYLIGILIVSHPVMVLTSEGQWLIPFEIRYWPEWLGIPLLTTLLTQIILTRWRNYVFRSYLIWRRIHFTLGFLALLLLSVHILNVSETFKESGLPRNLVSIAISGSVILWLWIRLRRRPFFSPRWKVIDIESVGANDFRIDLKPEKKPHFSYMPGQFAFLSFDALSISKEAHPFTLSSTPTRPETVQFIVRDRGDWTHRLNTIRKGDRAFIEGPYGRFSHRLLPTRKDIIMIAGGIGITPMLSMLRYQYDYKDSRRITLIWSNQTRAHLFAQEELNAIRTRLTNFTWLPIFTREKGEDGQMGRLDQVMLKHTLRGGRMESAIFLCGPPPMMNVVQADLIRIGFPKSSIHTEAFGF
jgi:predicted ferric reductase